MRIFSNDEQSKSYYLVTDSQSIPCVQGWTNILYWVKLINSLVDGSGIVIVYRLTTLWGASLIGSTLFLSLSSDHSSCSTLSLVSSVGKLTSSLPLLSYILSVASQSQTDHNFNHKNFFKAKTFREFSNERTRVERRENFRKLRIKENFYESINGYFDWITTAGSKC